MQAFLTAHATHPDAHLALALAAAQIDAHRAARQPAFVATLGLVYLTEAYAPKAEGLLAELQQRWPGVHWVGSVGVGVMASGVEYIEEPALVLMLCDLPPDSFQVFSGRVPLAAGAGKDTDAGLQPQCALVHADPATHDLEDLLAELAGRTASGYLFGGLSASRTRCLHIADGVFQGGLSGVAFAPSLALVSRVTQGCQPLGPTRRVTAADNNLALTLDHQPALPLLLAELGISLERPQQAMAALRATLLRWQANDTRLQPLLLINFTLSEYAPLSRHLSAVAGLLLERLGQLELGQAPPTAWLASARTALDAAQAPAGQAELAVAKAGRRLAGL